MSDELKEIGAVFGCMGCGCLIAGGAFVAVVWGIVAAILWGLGS